MPMARLPAELRLPKDTRSLSLVQDFLAANVARAFGLDDREYGNLTSAQRAAAVASGALERRCVLGDDASCEERELKFVAKMRARAADDAAAVANERARLDKLLGKEVVRKPKPEPEADDDAAASAAAAGEEGAESEPARVWTKGEEEAREKLIHIVGAKKNEQQAADDMDALMKIKKQGKYKVIKAHGGANEEWMLARLALLDELEKELGIEQDSPRAPDRAMRTGLSL